MSPYERGADSGAVLDSLIAEIRPVFVEAGFEHISVPIIQPAEPFLERLGEEFRRKIYTFDAPDGEELCLRPDFTISACLKYRGEYNGRPAKLCYEGPVFRHGDSGDWRLSESQQAGAELIGHDNPTSADAEAIDVAMKAIRAARVHQVNVLLGDLALYNSLLDALELPKQWAAQLKTEVWRPRGLGGVLERLASKHQSKNAFLSVIDTKDPVRAREAVRGFLRLSGIEPLGTRTMDEITERLLDQAAEAAPVPQETVKLISDFLKIRGPAQGAIEAIRKLTRRAGISIDSALSAMDRRFGVMQRQGLDLSRAEFAAHFGKDMAIYTGFVFELSAPGVKNPVAGGGRYDSLLQSLDASPMPAIGFAVFGEALLAAQALQDGRR